jgi:hypothetical protein
VTSPAPKSTLGSLQSEGLRIDADVVELTGTLRLYWKGRSGARSPAAVLTPYFERALADVSARGVPLEMHFEQLEHFNSSTVAALIHLIQSARSRDVRLIFVYDQNLKWQKLSFDALRVFVRSDGLLHLRGV